MKSKYNKNPICNVQKPGRQITKLLGRILFAAIVFVFSLPSWSRTVLDLDGKAVPVALADWGDFWVEEGALATPAEVMVASNTSWRPTDRKKIYSLDRQHTLWIRFRVPPAPDAERWYVEVPNPSIAGVTLFTQDSAGRWGEQRAGNGVPVAAWPVPHRHPLMPIAISAEVPTTYLLKIENGYKLSLPLQFVNESYLIKSEQGVSLLLGIFFGFACLAALVSALNAGSLRDPAYGYYALSVLMMTLTQATRSGIAGVHLWSNSPWWNEVSLLVLQTFQLVPLMLFASAAVSLPERSLRLHRALQLLALLGMPVSISLAFVPFEYRLSIFTLYGLVSQLVAIYAVLWAWRRGDRFAPWLILGFAPVVIAATWLRASNAGLVGVDFWTQYGTQIGVILELPVVIVILMLRSQHRRENTRRVRGVDRVDPATGLINEYVFLERLKRMMARSRRLKYKSAVMLVDVVNSDQTERDFGRKVANDLSLRVAERLLSTAREIDSAARLSEHRFGMLVEGPFTAEDVGIMGPRIVARCLMPYKGLSVECVARVRVVYALVPDQEVDAEGVVTALEEKLASISPDDKRAVFMVCDTAIPLQLANQGKPGYLRE
jgi:two-component system, sensor histidine kinase LadS